MFPCSTHVSSFQGCKMNHTLTLNNKFMSVGGIFRRLGRRNTRSAILCHTLTHQTAHRSAGLACKISAPRERVASTSLHHPIPLLIFVACIPCKPARQCAPPPQPLSLCAQPCQRAPSDLSCDLPRVFRFLQCPLHSYGRPCLSWRRLQRHTLLERQPGQSCSR